MASTIQGLKDSINQMTEDQRQTADELAKWREEIELLETVSQFNSAVTEVEGASDSIVSDVKRMLVQVGAERGFQFDKQEKEFTSPAEASDLDAGDNSTMPAGG